MKTNSLLNDFDMGKHFIFTRPQKVSEMDLDDLPTGRDFAWREKSHRLQQRRWEIIARRSDEA